jgi:hypothetical protein
LKWSNGNKEELQLYLYKKKMECLEYLEESKKRALERRRNRPLDNAATSDERYFDEQKMKRTDEFFKSLKLKDLCPRNMSSSKLDPIKSSGNSKQRVKWKDSDSNEQYEPNNELIRSYNENAIYLDRREPFDGKKMSAQMPSLNQSYEAKHYKDLMRDKNFMYNHKHSGVIRDNIRNTRYLAKDKKKDKSEKCLKITFKNPKNVGSERIGTSQDKKAKRTIELAIQRRRASNQPKGMFLIITE